MEADPKIVEETNSDFDTSANQIEESRDDLAPDAEEKHCVGEQDEKNNLQNENAESNEEVEEHTSEKTTIATKEVLEDTDNDDTALKKEPQNAPGAEEKHCVGEQDENNNVQNENAESSEEMEEHTSDKTTIAAKEVLENTDNDDTALKKKPRNAPAVRAGAVAVPGTDSSNKCVGPEPDDRVSTNMDVSRNQTYVPEFVPIDFPDNAPDGTPEEVLKSSDESEKKKASYGYSPSAAGDRHASVDAYTDDRRSSEHTRSPNDIDIEEPELIPFEGTFSADSQDNRRDQLLPLISARLVVEEESQEDDPEGAQGGTQGGTQGGNQEDRRPNDIIVIAKPLEKQNFCSVFRRSRTGIYWAVGILLLLVGLSIGLGVTLGRSTSPLLNPSPAPTSPPTPTLLTTSDLRDIIVTALPTFDVSFESNNASSSARQDALQWLFEDPLTSTLNEDRIVRRWILATFFNSLSGESWDKTTGWFSENECLWEGLSCNSTDDPSVGITSISMEANLLEGTLPPEIAWFNESLLFIQLKGNNIKGSIPTEIGLLTKLRRLTLRQNLMTGPIPTEMGLLGDLTTLRINMNIISGEIPSELGLLQNVGKRSVLSGK